MEASPVHAGTACLKFPRITLSLAICLLGATLLHLGSPAWLPSFLLLNSVQYLRGYLPPSLIHPYVSAHWGTQHDLLPPLDSQDTEWWRIGEHDDPTTDDFSFPTFNYRPLLPTVLAL